MRNLLDLEFLDLLTSHQARLYRYIVSLLGDLECAWDVLQETNRVLLQKRTEFEIGTSFVNWALTVAKFQTMAWLRDKRRDRHIVTSEIVELMSDEAVEAGDRDDSRQQALKVCLESLSAQHRELIHFRYVRSKTLSELADYSGRTVNALKQLFFRLRNTLTECVERRLEAS
jgi:RNA polymerase sigma-70 factor (ECF subfamily)